jgi:long-subunit fatty acid transport protein
MYRNVVIVALTAVLMCPTATAQFPEDALRLGMTGAGVGARALGMGNAYTGVAGDYSAVFWNPAGLAQSTYGELFTGLSYLGVNDRSTFFGISGSDNSSSTTLNALGFVFPVPVRRGSLVFALGYDRQSDFAGSVSFAGFNPVSSAIQQSAPDGALYPSDLTNNVAYQLFLADIDTLAGRFISPIRDRVTQRATVEEAGGLNNWSVAGALDISRNVSAGLTLTYVSGSYKYDRSYSEEDVNRVYETFPYDFGRYTVDEFVESDISGVTAKFGLLYREPDRYRLGFSIKTPTAYTVKERFGLSARSMFDNGDAKPDDGPFTSSGEGEYDVLTPWVFTGGGSFISGDLLLAGSVEFVDWSTLEFDNALPEVMALNRDIRQIYRPVVNFRGGAELSLGGGPRLRAGFAYIRSPYDGDPSSFDQKVITGGIGIPLGSSVMLDAAYAHGWYDTYRVNDGGVSRTDERIRTNTVLLTLISRF